MLNTLVVVQHATNLCFSYFFAYATSNLVVIYSFNFRQLSSGETYSQRNEGSGTHIQQSPQKMVQSLVLNCQLIQEPIIGLYLPSIIYRLAMPGMLQIAEKSHNFYAQTLAFLCSPHYLLLSIPGSLHFASLLIKSTLHYTIPTFHRMDTTEAGQKLKGRCWVFYLILLSLFFFLFQPASNTPQ